MTEVMEQVIHDLGEILLDAKADKDKIPVAIKRVLNILVVKAPEQIRKQVFNELEKQLFRDKPIKDEVCHLTWDIWQALKEK